MTSVKSLLSSGNSAGSAESAEVMVEEMEKIRAEAHSTCVKVRVSVERDGNGTGRRRAARRGACGGNPPSCDERGRTGQPMADNRRPPIADH